MKIPAWILEAMLLVGLLAVTCPLAMSLRTWQVREPDTRENLQIALNLQRYKVYSVLEGDDGPPQPTTKREPLYPILLSLWMAVLQDEGSQEVSPELARRLKSLNVILHLCLVLASWWAARTFSGNHGRPWRWRR